MEEFPSTLMVALGLGGSLTAVEMTRESERPDKSGPHGQPRAASQHHQRLYPYSRRKLSIVRRCTFKWHRRISPIQFTFSGSSDRS